MEVLRLLDQLKTFCSRHAALLSVAAVASSLIYLISGGSDGGSKPSSVRGSAPRSSLSSNVHPRGASSCSRGDVGVSGLENVGRNWCYSNGLLQAMASCPIFCSWIEHLLRASSESSSQLPNGHDGVLSAGLYYGAQGDKMPLIAQLKAVIRGVNDATYGTGSLKGIYEALEGHGWQISEGEHDCHEMLSVLCNTIQSELEGVERLMGYTQRELREHEKILSGNPGLAGRLDPASLLNVAWLPPAWLDVSVRSSDARLSEPCASSHPNESPAPPENKNKARVEDVLTRQTVASVRLQSKHMPFGGFFASQLQCLACGSKHAARWDRFECISLQLPVDASPAGVSLVSLLENYTSSDLVEDVTCDHCSKLHGAPTKRPFNKRITIGKLPELLVLHINRSVWTDSDNATYKRNDRVRYPMLLNMASFTYTHAVNNTVAPTRGGVSGVRGLSRLVEARFSARSSTARLPLTRKTASVASAGGVQTCADESASSNVPQKNSASNNAPSLDSSVSAACTADGSIEGCGKNKISKSLKLGSESRLPENGFDVTSPSKKKEFKCPKIVTPPRWFHSDLSEETDSFPHEENSAFVPTYRPSVMQSNGDANVNSERSREGNLSAETPLSANSKNIVVDERNGEEKPKESSAHKELLHNGAAPSREVSEENNIDDATPFDAFSTGANASQKVNNSSKTCSQDGFETGDSEVASSCANDCSGTSTNVNVISRENSNSAPNEKAEEQSTSLHRENQGPSFDHFSPAPQQETSPSSGLVTAANGPTQSQTASTAPSLELSECEGPVSDSRPSTSTHIGSEPSDISVNSSSEANRRNEKSSTSSSRSKRRPSDDFEHMALYNLRAVIVHSGSASSGHFTTFRRGPSGSSNWYFTSDETVRQCDMTGSIGLEPYMLFYERCQSLPSSAVAAEDLKSSLAAISLPFSNDTQTSLPRSPFGDDAPDFAVPRASTAFDDAAYFAENSIFA